VAAQQGEVDTFGLAEMASYDTDPRDNDWENSDKASEANNI
jgi:hypothetical protein